MCSQKSLRVLLIVFKFKICLMFKIIGHVCFQERKKILKKKNYLLMFNSIMRKMKKKKLHINKINNKFIYF